jgi:Na+/H+ antiporter
MHQLLSLLELVLLVAVVGVAARRFGMSEPILLVLAGIVLSFVPGFPTFALNPEVVLVFILPPLLFAASINASLPAFRANRRPIALLSVGLVLFTTLVVAVVFHAVLPESPWAVGVTLGAIVAPPDAVAATTVARRVGLPNRLVTILEGESLLNDATALVTYRIAITAVVTGTVSWFEAGWRFVLACTGGVVMGLAVAWLVRFLRKHLRDPLLDNLLSLLTPFAAYLAAESIDGSGVLAVVVTGLYLGYRGPEFITPAARLQSQAIWSMIEFLLQGVVFALIGLQLRDIVSALGNEPVSVIVVTSEAVLAAVIVARFVWVFPATYLPRRLSARLRARDPAPPWQYTFVVAWAGMRGVVSLAAAFAVPILTDTRAPFPHRDLLIFVSFAVIVGTLVVQGFTLPTVVRRLRLAPPDPVVHQLQEAAAQNAAAAAALQRLDELLAGGEDPPPGVIDQLRDAAQRRRLLAWERLGSGPDALEAPSEAYRRLRLEMLAAERHVFLRLRNEGTIDDEVMRRVQNDLDLEESILIRS